MLDSRSVVARADWDGPKPQGDDVVPPGTFHGDDVVPPGTFHGDDVVPPGTFH